MAQNYVIDVAMDSSGVQQGADEAIGALASLKNHAGMVSAAILGLGGVFAGFTVGSFLKSAIDQAVEFEAQIADIQKVTDRFTAKRLEASIQGLVREIPLARRKMASVVEEAGRLGIQGTDNIEKFTETISKLTIATDLTAKDASRDFARILAVTGSTTEEMDNLGAVVNKLSNTMATSTSEIVDGMLRVSAAASRFGLSAQAISAVSASINEVSSTARRGNTRLRRLFQEMQEPKTVEKLAKAFNDLSAEGFVKMREEAPVDLFEKLVNKFRTSDKAAKQMIQTFGSASRQALAGLSQNFEELTDSIDRAQKEFIEAESLQREFEIRIGTTASKTQLLKNEFGLLQQELGEQLLPTFNSIQRELLEWTKSFNETILGLTEFRLETAKVVGEGNLDEVASKLDQIGKNGTVFDDIASGASSLIPEMDMLADRFEKTGSTMKTMIQFAGTNLGAGIGGILGSFVTPVAGTIAGMGVGGTVGFQSANAIADVLGVSEKLTSDQRREILRRWKANAEGLPTTRMKRIYSNTVAKKISKLDTQGMSGNQIMTRISGMDGIMAETIGNIDQLTAEQTANNMIQSVLDSFGGRLTGDQLNRMQSSLNRLFSEGLKRAKPGTIKEFRSQLELMVRKGMDVSEAVSRAWTRSLKNGMDVNLNSVISQIGMFRKLSDLTLKKVNNAFSGTGISQGLRDQFRSGLRDSGLRSVLKGGLSEKEISNLTKQQRSQIAQVKQMYDSLRDKANQTFSAMESMQMQWGKQFSRTTARMLATGKANFKSLAQSFITDFLEVIVQRTITNRALNLLLQGSMSGSGKGFLPTGIPMFFDTPGVQEVGPEGGMAQFAPGDKFVAGKSEKSMREQLSGGGGGAKTVNQTVENNFPVVSDQQIDRRIQKAAPRIAEQAKRETLNALRGGGAEAQTARNA